MMTKTMMFTQTTHRRWLIVLLGITLQGCILMMVLISMQQPGQADVTFAPVADNPHLCRIVSVAPFTDAWVNGIRPGMLVEPTNDKPFRHLNVGDIVNCKPTAQSIRMQIIGTGKDFILILNTQPRTLDLTNLLSASILVIIFNLTGITIYLRTQNRSLACVAYGLFYCSSILFFLINFRAYIWINVLLYVLSDITYGLVTTFFCLVPHPGRSTQEKRGRRLLAYLPLFISLFLVALSLPLIVWFPQTRVIFSAIKGLSSLIYTAIILWSVLRGLRHLASGEMQIIRIVVAGIVFLLLPLAISPNFIPYYSMVLNRPTHLINIPMSILPIVCGYALIRHQLLGTTSLLSRQAMRVLLWILLTSLFVVPTITLIHVIEANIAEPEVRDYCYAGLLALGLWLFPFLWGKVRDVGDYVIYRDFYQYNQSLSTLSSHLTRLHHLDDICTFVLPQLKTMLNATGAALLVRARGELPEAQGLLSYGMSIPWRIYLNNQEEPFLPKNQLVGIANLALTHTATQLNTPLEIDGVLLLALYHGDQLSGFLCLGHKQNSEPYSRQDKSFLATLAAQLSVLEVNSRYLEQARTDAQKLTALHRRVLSAQEDERRHLALELHDEVLQEAMLLVRQLSDAGTMSEVAETMPLARSIVSSLRRTCLELRPPLLDELGLEEALSWLARQTEQHSRLQVEVSCLNAIATRPTADAELALYRVVQEALSNVVKHARATHALIRLNYSPQGRVSLLVCDNGRGFSQGQLASESLGLAGMHERMAAVGGRLQIRTQPGRGTVIRALYTINVTQHKPQGILVEAVS